MILIQFIHITLTERYITIKGGKAVTRNAEFTVAVVTLELLPAQQLQGQQIYKISLRQSKKFTCNGTRLVSYRLVQIIIYEHRIYFDK